MELLSRLGEFAKRSCSRLMSAYRLPSSSRSTALYDLQMACVAVRKCAADFVQHCGRCHGFSSSSSSSSSPGLQLDALLQPNARHLHQFSQCLAALDAVSWRFERLASSNSATNTTSLSGEQYLAKMVDVAEKFPVCIDRLTTYVRRAFEESCQPPPPLPPNTRHSSARANDDTTPASPTHASLRPQRRSQTGNDRWIDESDYIHFADARKQHSLDEQREEEVKLKTEGKHPVQEYVCSPPRTPLVQMRLSSTIPSSVTSPSHPPSSPSYNQTSSINRPNSATNPAQFPNQVNTTPKSTANIVNSAHNSSSPAHNLPSPAHSIYHSTPVQPEDQLYDLLPARINQKLRVSFDDQAKTDSSIHGNNNHQRLSNGETHSPTEVSQLSSDFEKKLRAVRSFDETPANQEVVGGATAPCAARASAHATESESAMLQHYAGQLSRALGDLRQSADLLVSDTVSGGCVDKVDALRHAHRLIYLSDAVSRRVVNLHELGARLSDYTAGMSVSLKSVNGVSSNGVKGDREKLLRAVENVYTIADRISTLVSDNAEISSR